MAYLSIAEIKTHLYEGVVNKISRDDDTIVQSAIDAGIAEAQGYLSAYDTTAIFAAEGAARNQIILLFIKDMVVWHYIQLANPAVEMDLRLKRYEQATKYFEKVQSGKATPQLPYAAEPANPGDGNNYIKYGGVEKRQNNF